MAKKQPVQELLAQCNSDKYCIPASLRVPAVFREGLQNLERYLTRIQYLIVLVQSAVENSHATCAV